MVFTCSYPTSVSWPDRLPSAQGILTAVTTARAHDLFDCERLETMGDAVLKYLASLYLYTK